MRPTYYFSLFIFLLLISTGSQAASINEIRIDQPSSDLDEFVELLGDDGESLNGLTYIVIGDGAGGSGVVESVTSLEGSAISASGLFVLAKEATIFTNITPDLVDSSLSFENSDNVTHLLVSGFTGASGDDLDTDDDGVLDITPWAAIVDSVSLIETDPATAGEQVYSMTQVGPDGTFVPGHVYRCTGGFEIGVFDPSDMDAVDTPGQANPCPTVMINEIRSDHPGTDIDEYVELIGEPGSPLTGLTHIIIGDGTGGSGVIESVVDLSMQSFGANGLFTMAKTATLLSASVTPDLVTTDLNLENSDNVTHLIVSDFIGASGDDLDSDDDGTLDTTPWTEIVDSVALQETDPSVEGEQLYSSVVVGPEGGFVPSHIFRCPDGFEIGLFDQTDANADDTPTQINDCGDTGGGLVNATIPEIQSNTTASPFEGQIVETSGVVTAVFTGDDELRGFYLQDPTGDADAETSDGIFVFYPSGAVALTVGDRISITAEVDEFFELTELTNVSNLVVESSGNSLPAPAKIVLPETVNGELERYEGMLVEIDSEMTISQNFFLARFGQMTLSSPDDNGEAGRLFQPTNLHPAGSDEAKALAEENARRTLILDDGQDISGFGDNPDPVPYIGKDPVSVIRAGDQVSNLIGILDYGRIDANTTPTRDYRLHPTQAPVFSATNPRTDVPEDTDGELTIASFNVLNYFTTVDQGADVCGPLANTGCRGADSAEELQRQQGKLISALAAIDADIVGLIEIENNGFGASSAIQTLVDALNIEIGSADYQVLAIDEGATPGLGGDAITVGFIFKPDSVSPVGEVATLDTGAFSDSISDGGFSRQPIAASFEDNRTGEQFTAVINHFKSKRPPASVQGNGNDDQGDGQGSWNLRRTEAANDLAAWLSTDPTEIDDSDILILGDLNAYAQEDPMLALLSNGYKDMIKAFNQDTSYSFTFDGLAGSLDHALASPSLVDKISGVTQWHTNTDEPPVLDYNTEFNPDGYFEVNPFRASDHDAIVVGLSFSGTENCFVIPTKNQTVVTVCF